MKLTNITNFGRYILPNGNKVNIKRGIIKGRCNVVFFYLFRMKRILVSNEELSKSKEI